MKRRLIVLSVILVVALTVYAANVFVSLSGVAATGAGTAMNVNQSTGYTWQTTFTGTPTAITVKLEGTIDGTNWFMLDSSTSTTAEMRHVVYKPVEGLRCNISAYTVNGSTTTCSIRVY